MTYRLRVLFLALTALSLLPTAGMLAQTQTLAEMQHVSWAGHDGAPLGIRAIALGPDGLLYLATFSGLYRFDGTSFEPVPVPDVVFSSIITNLYFTREGDLLLMPVQGAPALIHQHRGQLINDADGETIDHLTNAQQSPDGQIWAVLNERELVRLGKDLLWHRVSAPGSGHGHITHLFADPQGTLWVVVDDRLYRRPANGIFMPTDVFVYGMGKIMAGLHSDLWIASAGPATSSTPARHLQHLDGLGKPFEMRDVLEPLIAAYPAADGSVWLLTTQGVLAHLPRGELERGNGRFSVQNWNDHLALRISVHDDGAYNFLPTREGSLWIAGLGGIEYFEDATLVPLVPDATPGVWEQCSEADGSQWILDAHSSLHLRTPDGAMTVKGTEAVSLDCSPFGNLLLNDVGLSILTHQSIEALPRLPGMKGYGNHYIFTGSTRTSDGSIIAAAAGGAIGRSLWKYQGGSWHQLGSHLEGPEISGMFAMPQGEVYFGFRDGTVGILAPGASHIRSIGKPFTGAILGFSLTKQGLFAYDTRGVALWRGDSFTVLPFTNPQSATLVTGLAESGNGDLWLMGLKGIVRVPFGELAAVLHNPSHRIVANNISEGDYTGPGAPRLFCQSAQTDAKGRVWFNTLNGIVSVTPDAVKPSKPPPLVIKDVLADGAPLPPNRTLAPGVNALSIRYIGIDFSDPTGLSYSYKLEGYDDAWQNVGARTEAVYTHLRAGRYMFAVKARNAFGVWGPPVTLEPFVIQPHFYERRWFLIVSALLLAGLAWVLVQHRLRVAAANIRRHADERADERVTIARDLHDTLLQGVQGLLMTFHAATERVPANHESRPALEHALTSAEKLIIEGRDRVKGLRGVRVSGNELDQLLQSVAEDLSCSDRVQLSIYPGTGKAILRDDVAAELFLVGREALVNAARHSNASHIAMRLRFNPDSFTLECEDNGLGFEPAFAASRALQPRWGIPGMRERIEALQGHLRIRSAPGKGTLIHVFIPARFAYQ